MYVSLKLELYYLDLYQYQSGGMICQSHPHRAKADCRKNLFSSPLFSSSLSNLMKTFDLNLIHPRQVTSPTLARSYSQEKSIFAEDLLSDKSHSFIVVATNLLPSFRLLLFHLISGWSAHCEQPRCNSGLFREHKHGFQCCLTHLSVG